MSMKILVVDNEEMIADELADFFRQNGYTVFTAQDNVSAFLIYKENNPAAVITDYRLGVSTSDVLVKHIRKYEREFGMAPSTILLMSSSGVDTTNMGVDGFFLKNRSNYTLMLSKLENIPVRAGKS